VPGPARDDLPKITTSSTKKQMLDAFNRLKAQLEEQAREELKPEKVKREKREAEIIQTAEATASENTQNRLDKLKVEIGAVLSSISKNLSEETARYQKIKEA